MAKALVVEDEASIREMIALNLRLAGMEAVEAASAEAALPLLEQKPGCDAAILDVMLPGMNGFSLCETIRRTDQKIGIIILRAKGQEQDKIRGLSIGADDYMIKPFDSKELVARVKAVLRRFQPAKTESVVELKCVEYPDLTVNLSNYSVMYNGHPIDMPPKELELLYFLAASPNQVFTREQLLDHIWGYEYIGDTRTVDVHVKRLREKIKDHETWSIATVWGIGYKFEVKG